MNTLQSESEGPETELQNEPEPELQNEPEPELHNDLELELQNEPEAQAEREAEAETEIPLVSPLTSSIAAVKPVEKKNNNIEMCPKTICSYKRERRGRPWVQCSHCGQWCHCRCVGLTKLKAEKVKDWICPLCN